MNKIVFCQDDQSQRSIGQVLTRAWRLSGVAAFFNYFDLNIAAPIDPKRIKWNLNKKCELFMLTQLNAIVRNLQRRNSLFTCWVTDQCTPEGCCRSRSPVDSNTRSPALCSRSDPSYRFLRQTKNIHRYLKHNTQIWIYHFIKTTSYTLIW